MEKTPREMTHETPTPLVEVWEGIMMVPIIGALDARRAKQITEAILARISRVRTEFVIVSVGGISAIDSDVASHLIYSVQSIKLMGVESVITGVRPDLALTLIRRGIDLGGVVTFGTMHEGLDYAFRRLGWRVERLGAD